MESLIDGMVAEMRVAIFAVCTLTLLSSCGTEPSCQNEVLGKALSPSGNLSAVVFSRNCGATTGDNIQVSIVHHGEVPDGKGNALILDHAPSYSDAFKPAWIDDEHLTLLIPRNARVFLQEGAVAGVEVTYKKM